MNAFRSAMSSLRNFWIDRLWVDVALVGVFMSVHAALVISLPAFDVLGNSLPADRRGVYTSTAIVVSLLASFSGVAIGQVSSAKGDRADALRTLGGKALAQNWRSIFLAGMASAVMAIFALLLDPSAVTPAVLPVVVRWLFEAALLFALVKFVRLSSLFSEVLTLSALSAKEEDEVVHDEIRPNPEWHKTA